jgi:hypothetical protein
MEPFTIADACLQAASENKDLSRRELPAPFEESDPRGVRNEPTPLSLAVIRAGIRTYHTSMPSVSMSHAFDLLQSHDALLAALKLARLHVDERLTECGPCDHSVNICVCDIRADLEGIDAVIQKAETR